MLPSALACAIALLAPPIVFAPSVISGAAHETAPAFAPGGRSVLFGRSSAAASFILESHRSGSMWSKPVIANFSGHWTDMEPAMSPDGSYVVFASNRPVAPGGAPLDGDAGGSPQPGTGSNLWRAERVAAGWKTPVRLPGVINRGTSVFPPSVAANGDLYFMRPVGVKGRFAIFLSRMTATGYAEPEPLSFSDGSVTDVDPAVSPDGSFMVFGSGRHPGTDIDLFVTFHDDGKWSDPVNLGQSVNSAGSDAEPRIGPDGRTLYFSSDRTIPASQPMTTASASGALRMLSQYNNGLYNIWSVDLGPLLAAHGRGGLDCQTDAKTSAEP